MTRVVVIGDALLDRDLEGPATRLCPDSAGPVIDVAAERTRPGGAALTAAMLAADGVDTTLVTSIGDDDAGEELRRAIVGRDVALADCGSRAATPQKVRIRSNGGTIARLDIGCAVTPAPTVGGGLLDLLADADAVVASDYGRGLLARPEVRRRLADVARRVPIVWDPHRVGPAPVEGVAVATPNLGEACAMADVDPRLGPDAVARRVASQWGCTVALTCGAEGAVVAGRDGAVERVQVESVSAGDPCGAGDRFAGRLALELASGRALGPAVAIAAQVAAVHVLAGGAAASGGTAGGGDVVVAAGGCFDVIHAGHVRMLEYARSLGDRLVVLLNSDASIRRLKGPGRPINSEADRRAVVAALAPVDEVICFDGDDPCDELARLRPDVFVKGAEYAGLPMVEHAVLAAHGGRIVFAPMLAGRSTTRVLRLAGGAAAG